MRTLMEKDGSFLRDEPSFRVQKEKSHDWHENRGNRGCRVG